MTKPLVPCRCNLNVGVRYLGVALKDAPGWGGGGLEVVKLIAC